MNEYKNIFNYSNSLIQNRGFGYILPEDLVNEAYIRCWESSNINDLKEIKATIKAVYFEEFHAVGLISEQYMALRFGEQYCKGCNESIPVAGFRYRQTDNGFRFIESLCKNCEAKYGTEYQKKNRQKQISSQKKSYKNNPEKWLSKAKSWMNNARESLSDKYIIRLIKETKPFKDGIIEINPQIINEKREQIKLKKEQKLFQNIKHVQLK